MLIKENKKLCIYEDTVGYEIYLQGELVNSYNYTELIHILNNKNDDFKNSISIYLDSKGGASLIGLKIANAIKYSSYKVEIIVIGECCSAATFIALSANKLILHPSTSLYFHNYSKEVSDSGLALKKYIEATDKHMKSMFENIYIPFLSQEEVDFLRNDGEIYIHADDPTLKARLGRHFK